jgi:peptide-methionine (S)-S-oxide reductase
MSPFNALRIGSISLMFSIGTACSAAGAPLPIPAPQFDSSGTSLQTAVIAGGCFWGVEGVFEHVRGVQQVVSGYAGGTKASADYKTVSSGRTGHAESVQIVFDPQQVSYGKILQIFFSVAHDPTQLNRQGPDFGTQYRSAIFYANAEQQDVARKYLEQLANAKVFDRTIVTRLDPLQAFYQAEDYHQDFMENNPTHSYIVLHDAPKVRNLQRTFPDYYRSTTAGVKGSNTSGQ